MTKGTVAFAALLSFALAAPALADGMIVTHHHRTHHYRHHHYRLPPERHVVEKVAPPGSGIYLLNGSWYAAQSPRCASWVAGDRVTLVAVANGGYGYCAAIVIRNLSRRMTCELACGGS